MEPATQHPPAPETEDILPTYEAATNRDPLPLIAPYVGRNDLFSASLVSRHWREAFMKELWECPDTLWELGDRPVLTKFLLFLRTISTIPTPRPTRTLSLTAVQLSIYSTLPPKWLSHLFTRLPHLHTFSLTAFPFFDHHSLLFVSPAHTLRTLHATSCTNTTTPALSHLLSQLPDLVNLDLSSTNSASNPTVLCAISSLRHLRSLALRSLKLDDKSLSPTIRSLGTRLRKLDVGGNLLTDKTVDLLLDYGFAPPEYFIHPSVVTDGADRDSPPPVFAAEGLTHVRIAANRLSNVGVQALLKSTRLEGLDVGGGLRGGVEGVVAALSMYAWKTLRTLRIDVGVVAAGLRPGQLKGLETLVLVGVPSVAGARFADSLVALLRGMERCGVRVLELEVEEGRGGVGMYASESVDGGDFSFFSGREEEGEGGSSWGGSGGREVDVVEAVGKYRKACREEGRGWGGKVRVVRDLGGMESIERGIGGERWGVVTEGV